MCASTSCSAPTIGSASLGKRGLSRSGDARHFVCAAFCVLHSHKVHAAALGRRIQELGCRGLETLVRIRDDQLNPLRSRRVSERRNLLQNGSAPDGPTVGRVPAGGRRF
jgi:hypothetical protein